MNLYKFLPKDAKKKDPYKVKNSKNPNADFIFAEGEVTGHAHRVKNDSGIELFESEGRLFAVISENTKFITHEEHKTSPIVPGVYERRIQREFNYIEQMENKVKD